MLDGFFAAIAGIALTVLVAEAGTRLATQDTPIAIASVVLGGTPVGGGRGGLLGWCSARRRSSCYPDLDSTPGGAAGLRPTARCCSPAVLIGASVTAPRGGRHARRRRRA